jgi:hypothetical protein
MKTKLIIAIIAAFFVSTWALCEEVQTQQVEVKTQAAPGIREAAESLAEKGAQGFNWVKDKVAPKEQPAQQATTPAPAAPAPAAPAPAPAVPVLKKDTVKVKFDLKKNQSKGWVGNLLWRVDKTKVFDVEVTTLTHIDASVSSTAVITTTRSNGEVSTWDAATGTWSVTKVAE